MANNPTIRHPQYAQFASSWRLMRDAMAGEDDIKAAGERYLPMKTGTMTIQDPAARQRVYDLYKLRAEFPEVVAPTVRGSVGVMLGKAATIELPPALEYLRERATLDGLTIDALHRRIAMEVMITGRYGLLPGMSSDGVPYLCGYVAEAITNWDSDRDGRLDYVMLDESGPVRDRDTGEWSVQQRARECYIGENGGYVAREWVMDGGGDWSVGDEIPATTPSGKPLTGVPFVFVGTLDMTPEPDDVPLYGLAKLALRVYRLDADFSFSLHMTSEPTPVVTGFSDPPSAIKSGAAPSTLGSSVIWVLPEKSTAQYLEFSGPGLTKQSEAIADALARAAQFGAQVLQTGQSAESGEALKLRAASQTATLTGIAQVTASALERVLRSMAEWVGANPNEVVVTPNLEFFDRTMTPAELQAIVSGWLNGAYSHEVMFARLKKGGVIEEGRTFEDEQTAILADSGGAGTMV